MPSPVVLRVSPNGTVTPTTTSLQPWRLPGSRPGQLDVRPNNAVQARSPRRTLNVFTSVCVLNPDATDSLIAARRYLRWDHRTPGTIGTRRTLSEYAGARQARREGVRQVSAAFVGDGGPESRQRAVRTKPSDGGLGLDATSVCVRGGISLARCRFEESPAFWVSDPYPFKGNALSV